MKVSVLNLGCKVNQAECSEIETRLRARGCSIAELSEHPDYCVINTCSVTSKSDYQSRQLIRRAHRSGAKVIVTGCYAELNKETVALMSGVAKVVENSAKLSIIDEIAPDADTPFRSEPGVKSRFFLKVQDGCNFSCSYCIIPKARGRSRSYKLDDIVRKAEGPCSEYAEFVLTGIHLGTYGYDLNPQVKLANLVRALLRLPIKRIRLSSLEINEIQDDLLELLQDNRVCSHLHIPMQSGNDGILRLMNRSYDSRTFGAGIEKICKEIPGIAIGTDVIVGFPGEGRTEFESTRKLLESMPFSYLHVFPFSARPGTSASTVAPMVPPDVKKQRCAMLIELGRLKKHAFMQAQLGKILDPLIEGRCEDGRYIGTTGNYLKVKTFLDRPSLKEIVNVRVSGCVNDILTGLAINSR